MYLLIELYEILWRN